MTMNKIDKEIQAMRRPFTLHPSMKLLPFKKGMKCVMYKNGYRLRKI